ncbi:MAG TPA: hypothetical protein VM575_20105 [Nocardioides sp.]|jgi:hypothetical protein|nr:hypothetical protein [Nocardioides sp.]
MPQPRTGRQARQDLADRLILEYAGAVPAGQVLAAVLRVERLLLACQPDPHRRIALCEDLVRRRLVEHTTGQRLTSVAS